jgi:DNA helicase-2/ATP-dependent DNA helicase PcrA
MSPRGASPPGQGTLFDLEPEPEESGPAKPRFTPAQLARLLGVDEPTAEQAEVISAPLEPMAVIAGAGSGKSETMAARLVWLVANGYLRPERVLGLTFTRKAAVELAGRVRARLDGLRRVGLAGPASGNGTSPELDGDPVIATYHAYAGRLIADHALREALEPSVRLITPAVAWQLAARITASYDGPMDAIDWVPVTVTAAVIDLAAELAEHLRGPDDVIAAGDWLERRFEQLPAGKRRGAETVLKGQRVRAQLLPLVRAYTAAKAEREVIDYGDQIAIAARIALRHPEVGVIERARYQVVLLDEFQDTSFAQLELLRALFGGGHPVTAVGDPCQSIYGWRGASAGNLKRFAASFPPAGGKLAAVRQLSTSFRNTGRVLDIAAELQRDLRGDSGGRPPEPALRGDSGGRPPEPALRAETAEVPRLIAPPARAERGAVVCALLKTSADEAEWVAEQVAGLLELPVGLAPDGQPWPDGRTDQVRPSDIAVLCRKRAQFVPLRTALEARGIPVEVVGLGGLLTVAEVADIVATLRVLHSPAASESLARTLTSPRWRIGPQDLVALGARARELAREARGPVTGPEGESGAGSGGSAGGSGGSSPGVSTAVTSPNEGGASGAGAGAGQGAKTSAGLFAANDFLSRAVADFTAETGSLVEALEDLGEPESYSADGYSRLNALAAELRGLRRHVARPLPELVAEVERVLGLDVEVAARPGADPAAARADLDAFADAAAAFAGDAKEPTLGAFLAYLTAAETEEFGLEAGQVSDADSVKLATVHSAKGLQWPAVVVPGLAAGTRAQVFPARARLSTRWTDNPRLLPFWLRGDASDLPELTGLDPDALRTFGAACSARNLAEERRLAYVAVTRAAYWLGCSGYWWGAGKSPLGPSAFLAEVRAGCEAGAGQVAAWADEPGPDEENPVLAQPLTASWPAPPSAAGTRYVAVREGGDLVRAAMAGPRPRSDERPEPLPDRYAQLIAGWAADADLLLAERSRRRPDGPVPVELPHRIGVSALVAMAADPAELAARIRRPMPGPPAPKAQRGSAFHRWLEERFGQIRLIDADELPGAADAELIADDADLVRLKERFEAGEWGQRWPADVEVPFETRVSDRLVRGRIDAIFTDAPDGRIDIVDWKTGRPPEPGSGDERAVAVQLAAYRLASAALAGVPVERVRAGFYYVRRNRTVRPADLLDAAGLAALIESVPVVASAEPAARAAPAAPGGRRPA